MNGIRSLGRFLLWFHLFVCCVWFIFFQLIRQDPEGSLTPLWMSHVLALSILAIQFTWGFTIGLNVGPGRRRRHLLWWSLLTVFMPLWFFGWMTYIIAMINGLLWAVIYLAAFTLVLACETFCGVLLGVQAHALDSKEA